MDDILELDVGENEFVDRCENAQNLAIPGESSCVTFCEVDSEAKATVALDVSEDFITLAEANEKLLENLKEFEEDTAGSTTAKPSVKSRLGARKVELVDEIFEGNEEHDEEMELMDCSDSETCDYVRLSGDARKERQQTRRDGVNHSVESVDPRYQKKLLCKRDDDHPVMFKILCKRLKSKWHHSPEKIGKEIATRLEEPKYHLIINVVKIIGGKNALALFCETKHIQLNGGMCTNNGSRKRTSGGVFLTLLKNSNYANDKEIKEIFKDDSKLNTDAVRRKRALQRQRRREKQKMETQSAGDTMSTATKQQEEDATTTLNTATIADSTIITENAQASTSGIMKTYIWCTCKQERNNEEEDMMLECETRSKKKCPGNGYYHMTCLGLNHIPKGKWLCQSCKNKVRSR